MGWKFSRGDRPRQGVPPSVSMIEWKDSFSGEFRFDYDPPVAFVWIFFARFS
jgi:hypothetical protein